MDPCPQQAWRSWIYCVHGARLGYFTHWLPSVCQPVSNLFFNPDAEEGGSGFLCTQELWKKFSEVDPTFWSSYAVYQHFRLKVGRRPFEGLLLLGFPCLLGCMSVELQGIDEG